MDDCVKSSDSIASSLFPVTVCQHYPHNKAYRQSPRAIIDRLVAEGKLCPRKTAVTEPASLSEAHTHVTHTPHSKKLREIHGRLCSLCLDNPQRLSFNTSPPPPSTKHTISKWVVFTARERALRPRLSPTLVPPRPGSRPLPTRSLTRSASWPGRVLLPLRSVLSSGIATVLLWSRLLLVSCDTRNEQKKAKRIELTVFSENR